MQKHGAVPIKTLFAIYLGIFIVLWILLPISSSLDALVIGLVLLVSFSMALLAGVLTLTAPLLVLAGVGLTGLISVGIGIYFWITVPEGILDPLFIIIGGGVFLAELLVVINRYWQGRRRELNSDSQGRGDYEPT